MDSFDFPRIDLLKIDVEGMEADVLSGASKSLQRCRPILYVEHAKSGRDALIAMIEGFGYETHSIGALNVLGVPVERRHQVRVN